MKQELYVLLNNVRSLYNVGSIFRSSDGAFVKKIFLCGQTAYPPRDEISKTAIGAEKSVEWEYWIDALECIETLKAKGIKILSLEQSKNSINYKNYKAKGKTCLILGNEIDGISKEILDLSDDCIEIEMQGIKKSLNVSVAFGIAIFSLRDN